MKKRRLNRGSTQLHVVQEITVWRWRRGIVNYSELLLHREFDCKIIRQIRHEEEGTITIVPRILAFRADFEVPPSLSS